MVKKYWDNLFLTTAILTLGVFNSACNAAISTNSSNSNAIVGEAYSKQIQALNGTHYSLLTPPEGMTINPRTGKIYWTPTPNQAGEKIITVSKLIGTSESVEQFTLSVQTSALFPDLSTAMFFSPTGLNKKITLAQPTTNPISIPNGYVKNSKTTQTLPLSITEVAPTTTPILAIV